MRNLSIDRFNGRYAICEDEDGKVFAISREDMPENVKEGDILTIDDDGEIELNVEKTKEAKNRIKKLQDNLWK